MGRIYMIIGKSASGKDHIYRRVRDDKTLKLKEILLYTTRPKRTGEQNGREYYFTDTGHLEELRNSGKIIEERVYPTVHGNWYYFTADEGQIKKEENYITIGTLQSYVKMREYFGNDRVIPVYIESDPYLRLQRSIRRERKQLSPEYKEVCRRFLADEEDFSEERLQDSGVDMRFLNNGELADCVSEVINFIRKDTGKTDVGQNRI